MDTKDSNGIARLPLSLGREDDMGPEWDEEDRFKPTAQAREFWKKYSEQTARTRGQDMEPTTQNSPDNESGE